MNSSPMDRRTVSEWADRISAELHENILPFWMKRAVDASRGIIIGSVTDDPDADRTAERGALLASRVLWTYSAAYLLDRNPAYLETAHLAYRDLVDNFWDDEHGGLYWSIAADGTVVNPRKQIYGQAFAIYALAEYHRASGLKAPLDRAVSLFELLETHAREHRHGGYMEALSREWSEIADMRLSDADMNVPKSQNTHLHVMEAYTNLLRTRPDAKVTEALTMLLEIMIDRIVNSETGHLKLFFSNDWVSQSEAVSYGHDIEAAWLLLDAAEALGNDELIQRLHPLVVTIAETTLTEGVDTDGGVFYTGDPSGVVNTDKEWWPQAEAVLGFLCAYQVSEDERYLKAAWHSWHFIDKHLIDRRGGEWFRGVSRNGAVLSPPDLKGSFWKCPYHNGRACMEAPRRLRALLQ